MIEKMCYISYLLLPVTNIKCMQLVMYFDFNKIRFIWSSTCQFSISYFMLEFRFNIRILYFSILSKFHIPISCSVYRNTKLVDTLIYASIKLDTRIGIARKLRISSQSVCYVILVFYSINLFQQGIIYQFMLLHFLINFNNI